MCMYVGIYEFVYIHVYMCVLNMYTCTCFTVDKQMIHETYRPTGLEQPPVVWETMCWTEMSSEIWAFFVCIIYLHIWADLWYDRHHVTCNIQKIPPSINQTGSDVIFINMKKTRKSWILCHGGNGILCHQSDILCFEVTCLTLCISMSIGIRIVKISLFWCIYIAIGIDSALYVRSMVTIKWLV